MIKDSLDTSRDAATDCRSMRFACAAGEPTRGIARLVSANQHARDRSVELLWYVPYEVSELLLTGVEDQGVGDRGVRRVDREQAGSLRSLRRPSQCNNTNHAQQKSSIRKEGRWVPPKKQ